MPNILRPLPSRDLPRYGVAEAARILDVPAATVRAWSYGRILHGRGAVVPLIVPASSKSLSFTNLVELHVLRAMRRVHGVSMSHVRQALDALGGPAGRPLATRDLLTDGRDVFVQELGRLVKLTNSEQLSLHEHLRLHLERVHRDEQGIAVRMFPFMSDERNVLVDPEVSFGRPVLAGTGIPLANLVERFDAGESVEDLASDFGLEVGVVKDAIRVAVRDAA
jgi:uncharacterized protein (DUF433 family)